MEIQYRHYSISQGENEEILTCVPTQTFPNVTTFEYTEIETPTYNVVAKESTIIGNKLTVAYDTSEANNFETVIYLLKNGEPYKVTAGGAQQIATNNNILNGHTPIYWNNAGTSLGFLMTTNTFDIDVPYGCTVMLCFRRADGGTTTGTYATSYAAFAQWIVNGGITAKVTNELGEKYINPDVKFINDRGYNDIAPENTLPAFELSAEKRYKYVASTVRFTMDFMPVMINDGTIDRTSNGAGIVQQIDFATIRGYDFGSWKSAEYAGTQIPTFTEFMQLCCNLDLYPYVAMTTSNATRIDGCLSVVNSLAMQDKITWLGNTTTIIDAILTANATARVGYKVNTVDTAAVTYCKNKIAAGYDVFIYTDITSYATETVTLCSNDNVPLELYTIDDIAEVEAIDEYITGVATNSICIGKSLTVDNVMLNQETAEEINRQSETIKNGSLPMACCGVANNLAGIGEETTVSFTTKTSTSNSMATITKIKGNTIIVDGELQNFTAAAIKAAQTRALPIVKYFPEGMNGVSGAYDELTPTKAIKKFVYVDLGTLNYTYNTGVNSPMFYTTYTTNDIAKGMDNNGAAICGKYNCAYGSTSNMTDKTMQIRANSVGGRIYIRDTDYTNSTALKTSLSGVYLVYELATPIETDIDTPLNFNYKTEIDGTEEIVSTAANIVPCNFDIIYGADAVEILNGINTQYASIDTLESLTSALASALNLTVTKAWDSATNKYIYTVTNNG